MKKILFLLVGSLFFAFAQGEKNENKKSDFFLKEQEMIKLLDKHIPKLEEIKERTDGAWSRVQAIAEKAKYPKNIIFMKDTAMQAIVVVRKTADRAIDEIKNIHYEWIPKTWDLMAVFTRYGELLATAEDKKNVHPELKEFLMKYRKYITLMQDIIKTTNDIKNETDFLLSSKFN